MKKRMSLLFLVIVLCVLSGCGNKKEDSTIRYTVYYYRYCVDNYHDYLYSAPMIHFENGQKVSFSDGCVWFEYTQYIAQGIEHEYPGDGFPDAVSVYANYDIDGDVLTVSDENGTIVTFTIIDEDTLRLNEDFGNYLKKGDEFVVSLYTDNPSGQFMY